MNRWDKLSMADRAKYIKLAVENGVTELAEIRNTYNSYAEGGYLGDENHPITLKEVVVTPQSSALARSRQARRPNADFSHAQDMTGMQRFGANYLAGVPIIGTNPHTCLNTVTGFYDSNNTVAANIHMVAHPEDYGYKEISQKEAIPGDLIILSNKDNHPTHAVMFDQVAEGNGIHRGFPFAPGDTLVNYSNGGRGNKDYRIQGPLPRFDDPEKAGGDFSGVHRYFRYVGKKKPKKTSKGNKFDEGGPNEKWISTGNDTADTVLSFLPVVGTAMDIEEAIRNPSIGTVGSAALSLGLDLIGGSLVKGLVRAARVAKAAKTVNKLEKNAEVAYKGATKAYRKGQTKKGNRLLKDAAKNKSKAKDLKQKYGTYDLMDYKFEPRREIYPIINTTAAGASFNGLDMLVKNNK